MPKVPRATAVSPITAPLENATRRAAARLERAACVVRTAALVAVCIPIQPAKAEAIAPRRKLRAINQPPAGSRKARAANITTTNPARVVYSTRRKAMAPCRICAAMRCIFSVPGSARSMFSRRKTAKAAATSGAPNPKTKNKVSLMVGCVSVVECA